MLTWINEEIIMMFFGYLILSVASVGLGFIVYKSYSADRKKQFARVQVEIPRWQNAMERWNQLYYCFRDDGVFIPADDQLEPIAQMTEYIYQS